MKPRSKLLAEAIKQIEIAHIEHEGNWPTPCTKKNCHLLNALAVLRALGKEGR